MSSLPPLSCGCALPAKTSCTGRSGSPRRRLTRSRSLKRSAARLYVAKRRAKPMVSACGSSTSSASVDLVLRRAPRRSAVARSHRRASVHEPVPAVLVRLPRARRRGSRRRAPRAPRSSRCLGPARPEVAREERAHLVADPGRGVHAVGDRLDGDLVVREVGPERLPHLARDLAVELAHAVVVIGRVDREDGHRERRDLVARVDAPEARGARRRRSRAPRGTARGSGARGRGRRRRCRRGRACAS